MGALLPGFVEQGKIAVGFGSRFCRIWFVRVRRWTLLAFLEDWCAACFILHRMETAGIQPSAVTTSTLVARLACIYVLNLLCRKLRHRFLQVPCAPSNLKQKVNHVVATRGWRQTMLLLHHPRSHTKSIYAFNGAISAYLGCRHLKPLKPKTLNPGMKQFDILQKIASVL